MIASARALKERFVNATGKAREKPGIKIALQYARSPETSYVALTLLYITVVDPVTPTIEHMFLHS